jgi:hypothetical protein
LTDTRSLLTRVRDIYIGVDGNTYFTFTGVRDVEFEDTDPFIKIKIPLGKMIQQEIISPHIEGEIHCLDLTAFVSAIFGTAIDADGHKAIDVSTIDVTGSIKYTIGYFAVNYTNQAGVVVTATFQGVKINRYKIGPVRAGTEGLITIFFCADEVTYTIG